MEINNSSSMKNNTSPANGVSMGVDSQNTTSNKLQKSAGIESRVVSRLKRELQFVSAYKNMETESAHVEKEIDE